VSPAFPAVASTGRWYRGRRPQGDSSAAWVKGFRRGVPVAGDAVVLWSSKAGTWVTGGVEMIQMGRHGVVMMRQVSRVGGGG
jgi:hypothetical protein